MTPRPPTPTPPGGGGYTISVNGEPLAVAGGSARDKIEGGRGTKVAPGAGVDPRIIQATHDTDKRVDENGRRVTKETERADRNAKKLKDLDERGAGKVRGVDGKGSDSASSRGGGKDTGSGSGSRPSVPMQQAATQPQQQTQAPAAMQMPQVQMPQASAPSGGGVTMIDPQKLAALVQAVQAAQASDRASGKPGPSSTTADGRPVTPQGKAPIDVSEVSLEKTTDGPLTQDQVRDVIDQALTINGIPNNPELRAQWTEVYEYIAQKESGNNPNAGNNSDSNATGPMQADGYYQNSSRGLVQCIPATFAAYHMGGTSNSIVDPVASVAASINYVMDKYGVSADGAGLAEFYAARGGGGASYKGY